MRSQKIQPTPDSGSLAVAVAVVITVAVDIAVENWCEASLSGQASQKTSDVNPGIQPEGSS